MVLVNPATEPTVKPYRLNTHKVTRPAKAPMVIVDDLPGKCGCSANGKYVYGGVFQNVQPKKWQFTCDTCGKSVLSYTAPQAFAVSERERIKAAKEAEEAQRRKQKERLFGLGLDG
jgi:hypothetical protein